MRLKIKIINRWRVLPPALWVYLFTAWPLLPSVLIQFKTTRNQKITELQPPCWNYKDLAEKITNFNEFTQRQQDCFNLLDKEDEGLWGRCHRYLELSIFHLVLRTFKYVQWGQNKKRNIRTGPVTRVRTHHAESCCSSKFIQWFLVFIVIIMLSGVNGTAKQ